MEVPFNRPHLVGTEFELIAEAIGNSHLAGNGPFSERCSEWLERELEADRVLLTHSCTGALEMAALLAGVEPGDEVIMPSFTFPSTANAFVLRGAVPVFVDIREDTLNLDESLVEVAVGPRTRAIVPVAYAGVPCEMEEIARIAEGALAVVIEDAAQALGSRRAGRPAGTGADMAALSFHETKNVICGEGGALVLNSPEWVERAEIIHEKGTNRAAFHRGHVDKYNWVDVGSSFVVSEIAAAFLWAQLQEEHRITASRVAIWERYQEGFADLERDGLLRRPIIPDDVEHNAHLYYLLMERPEMRDEVLSQLNGAGIGAVFHYVPLHSAPAGVRHGRVAGDLPVTERAGTCLIRLPLWVDMTTDQVDRVIAGVEGALRPSPFRARSGS